MGTDYFIWLIRIRLKRKRYPIQIQRFPISGRTELQNPHLVHHSQLLTLHYTVIGFALDWESHKPLKHDRECLTELLERAFFPPYPIQGIQPVEVDWESDNKGCERKKGWVVCIKSRATFSVLV